MDLRLYQLLLRLHPHDSAKGHYDVVLGTYFLEKNCHEHFQVACRQLALGTHHGQASIAYESFQLRRGTFTLPASQLIFVPKEIPENTYDFELFIAGRCSSDHERIVIHDYTIYA